jgi:uncharacterized protein YbjT (DUF2867 family)
MKTALLVGSTGLIGSYLLNMLLSSEHYEKVTILVRKTVGINHPKLNQVLYEFDRPFVDKVRADDVYCCLGTTIRKAGSKQAFRKVDYEYPLQIASFAHTNGAKRFAIVTAIGSDEKSFFFYSRVKGEVEAELKKIPFNSLYIFRPSMLLGIRKEFRLGEDLAKIVMRAAGPVLPANTRAIHASQVAEAMVVYMQNGKAGIQYVDSGAMQSFSVDNNPPMV